MNSRVGEIEVRDGEPEDARATLREIRYRITLGPAT
jgi:hypothetical protein